MKYFVHSVQTYLAAGKSRKGALLQAVASRFEGTILDQDALDQLTKDLRKVVDSVNKNFKGKPLSVAAADGWICVRPEYNGNDNHVFSISYKPVKQTFSDQDVNRTIFDVLSDLNRTVAAEFVSTDKEEGGEQ